jgi:hypothetical protein
MSRPMFTSEDVPTLRRLRQWAIDVHASAGKEWSDIPVKVCLAFVADVCDRFIEELS